MRNFKLNSLWNFLFFSPPSVLFSRYLHQNSIILNYFNGKICPIFKRFYQVLCKGCDLRGVQVDDRAGGVMTSDEDGPGRVKDGRVQRGVHREHVDAGDSSGRVLVVDAELTQEFVGANGVEPERDWVF